MLVDGLKGVTCWLTIMSHIRCSLNRLNPPQHTLERANQPCLAMLVSDSMRLAKHPLPRVHQQQLGILSFLQSALVPVRRREVGRESGCSSSRTRFLVSITSPFSSSASCNRPWLWYVAARLDMPMSESGCSSPSTRFLVSITSTSSSSASFHRPCLRYVDARLAMLVSESGCSSPSTRFVVSITRTSSSSASFNRPWFQYVDA